MAQVKGIEFIYIFVGALIGLMFSTPISNLAASVAANSTNGSIEQMIYSYLGAMYALCLLGLMVGSLATFFYSRR